ncbi:MAG: glycosyltransferase family 4 protein, partial [Deltaproteobacteria bacterium]|nr:glycosyltransferase family 4 protein [Deltaproteobacteria bacterium]
MNVLFVSDVSIKNVIGGGERVLYEKSTGLRKRGHAVHVFTRRLPVHVTDHESIDGVEEWRYSVDTSNGLSFFRSTIVNGKKLFDFLEGRYAFQFINFHQPFSAFSVLRSPLSRSIKKIYTCHSLSFEEYRSRNKVPPGFIGKMGYLLNVQMRKYIEGRCLRDVQRITVESLFTREKLRHSYGISPQKVTIVPGGVDLKRFSNSGDKAAIRQRLNISADRFVLFTVRNLVARMGLDNLIHAMRDVIKGCHDVLLVVGGEGPLREELLSLVMEMNLEKYVSLVGFIPEDDLPDYYRMADIFVLPTLELEGFGLVTLEAMASAVPVLGTPVGGTVEILSR